MSFSLFQAEIDRQCIESYRSHREDLMQRHREAMYEASRPWYDNEDQS